MNDQGRDLLRVDRLGPAGGGCLSILAALLVLTGFVLPWASCAGNTSTGLQLTTSGLNGDIPNPAAALLGLAPCLALGLLGVGLALLPAAARERIRAGLFSARAALAALLGALALAGLGLAAGFYAGVRQAEQTGADLIGIRGLVTVTIEAGFWVTAAGFLVGLLGAALALVTAFLKIPLRRSSR